MRLQLTEKQEDFKFIYDLKDDIKTIYSAFEKAKPYQFLDKHHSHLLFDVINNQLAYPMHCNTKMCKRYKSILAAFLKCFSLT